MSRTDDRADVRLPVTAEVGSEGGSFADPTMQIATFHDNEPRHDRAMDEGRQPAGGTDAEAGMLRYPTEPPASRASEGASRAPWRAGLLGAAAGAAAGAVVAFGLLKRRSPREG